MAGATKRMSAEEKRKTILDVYHKAKQVYTEKEILTLCAKAGVNANTYVKNADVETFQIWRQVLERVFLVTRIN